MIYAYRHLPHRIEKFHGNFIYFFQKMVEKDLAVYNEKELLKADFAAIVNNSGKLVGEMKKIAEQYHLLSGADKTVIKQALINNCEIENLCTISDGFTPIKYEQISSEAFRKLLKDFLTELWEGYPFVNAIRDNFGTVQEHFIAFKRHQNAHVCPFCGLNPLEPSTSIHRDDYDHYIPKAFYPFTSVNFKNLFPICKKCNSVEKKSEDTLYKDMTRRQVFYPLDEHYDGTQLSVLIEPSEPYNKHTLRTLLDDIRWNLAITLAGHSDPKLIAWDEVFRIKSRYKEHLLDYQKTWFDDFLLKRFKEDKADNLTFTRFKEKLLTDAKGQIKDNPLSILRFVYFSYILNLPDVEMEFNELVS